MGSVWKPYDEKLDKILQKLLTIVQSSVPDYFSLAL